MAAYQTEDASRIFVPFARNATGGSASINEDKTEPPKQQSIALNQQATGLRTDTSTAPETKGKDAQIEIKILESHHVLKVSIF